MIKRADKTDKTLQRPQSPMIINLLTFAIILLNLNYYYYLRYAIVQHLIRNKMPFIEFLECVCGVSVRQRRDIDGPMI